MLFNIGDWVYADRKGVPARIVGVRYSYVLDDDHGRTTRTEESLVALTPKEAESHKASLKEKLKKEMLAAIEAYNAVN
jgi:hypothetical protein